MFNPFKVFYWGFATVLKLLVIAIMYLGALACAVVGAVSIIKVGQLIFYFFYAQFGESVWTLIWTFSASGLYIALLGGIATVLVSGAGLFIAWGFKKDVTNVIDLIR